MSKGSTPADAPPSDFGTGKVFMHGRSQAVRLPKAYRIEGDRVRITRHGNGLLLQPEGPDFDGWLAELKRMAEVSGPFPEREQPGWDGVGDVDVGRPPPGARSTPAHGSRTGRRHQRGS